MAAVHVLVGKRREWIWSLECVTVQDREVIGTTGRNEAYGQGEGRNSSGGRVSVDMLRNDAYG